MNNESRTCDNCGRNGAKVRRVTRTYGKGEELLIVENVPVVCCPNCGESYLEAGTLHELERIKLHRESFSETRTVDVASYA